MGFPLRLSQLCALSKAISVHDTLKKVKLLPSILIGKTVRSCFLMGGDDRSGKNFDHRKQWIEDKLKLLAESMGIDLLAFSCLSNHFHLLLRSRPSPVVCHKIAGPTLGQFFSSPVSLDMPVLSGRRHCGQLPAAHSESSKPKTNVKLAVVKKRTIAMRNTIRSIKGQHSRIRGGEGNNSRNPPSRCKPERDDD